MLSYFDSHAHLTADSVYDSINLVLTRAQNAGVRKIINICTDLKTLERGLELSKRCPWIFQAASTTPHDVEKEGEQVFEQMAACARSGQLIAVGETGLDYHYTHSNPAIQKAFLRRYLRLAQECQLPVIIHCREAFKDLFEILDQEYPQSPGVLHCFTGTLQEAEQVLNRGWMLSLSGIVTFKKSIELQEVAKKVPLSQLLIETDTPYLAPQEHRGKMNEPAFIVNTAQYIADLRGISLKELVQATAQNACQLFKI